MASPVAALFSQPTTKRKPTGTQQLGDRHKRCAKEAPQPACNPFAIASGAGAKATSALPADESDDEDDV